MKKSLKNQKGIIKEIVIVIAVIFVLAYFNLDPAELWAKIVDFWNSIFN